MKEGLTIDQIKQAGNRITSQSIETMRMTTLYGKSTYNVWQSYDGGKTFVNVHCYTA
jgi:hypothetical protein